MRWLEAIWQDVRYAMRAMRSSAGLTAVAVLSLALGIGATTAIFSVMYAMAFRPLPVAHPEQLVGVEGQIVGVNRYSYQEWKAFRERQDIFADVFAYNHLDTDLNITDGKQTRSVSGLYVSGDYFRALGVPAAFGRVLQPSDDQTGAPPVCVLGYGLWRRMYGESQNILGHEMLVNGHEFQIIGVAPRSFFGVGVGHQFELFMPLEAERTYKDYELLNGHQTPSLDNPDATLLSIFGRLRPGESLSQANAGLSVLAPELSRALSPSSNEKSQRSAAPMVARPMKGSSDAWLEDMDVMLLLMAMAAIALIIACANLGNLLLARATKRQGEIATRLALGATRWRLVRQLLTESAALSLIGATAGLLIEHWGTQALLWALSWPDDKLSLDLSWDARLAAFAIGITLACALLFGLAPAIRATGISIYSAMNNGVSTGRRSSRFSNSVLVVLQVALSMALLVSAGLLARTLHAFLTADPGFDARGVVTAQATWNGAGENPQRAAFVGEQLLTAFRSVPGVMSASWTRVNSQMYLAQLTVRTPGSAERHLGSYNIYVSSGFFTTRHTPMLAGRDFNDADTISSLPVAVLSKTLAEMLFPGRNPVGLRFRENDSNGKGQDYEVEVIGVAADMQYRRPDLAPLPIMYRPVSQCASCLGTGSYEVQVAGAFPEMEKRLGSAAAAVDPHVALKYDPLSNMFNGVLHRNRAMELIAMTFSLFVGLLAMIGVYGVTSYAASQRTREIGIRMTLGAQRADVFRMILREAIVVVFIGVAAGTALAYDAAQAIRGMLWGVKPTDPLTFAGAVCLMIFVAAIAAFLPAWRAAKADPMVALRTE